MRVTARDSKQRKRSETAAAFAALLFLLPVVALPLSFEQALALEKDGKEDEARAAYTELLELGDENYCTIALRLTRLLSRLEEKRALLVEALKRCNDPERIHEIYVNLAGIEEIAGNLEAAQQYYQSASLAVGQKKDFRSLLLSAILLFETGNYRGAEAQATVILDTCKVEELRQSAEVLLSRVFFASEKEEKALQIARRLINERKEALDPAAIFWIAELAGFMDAAELAKTAANLLLTKYPESPEAQIYTGTLKRLPSLSVFIGPGQETSPDPAEETTATTPPADSQRIARLSIQTGSYSVRENAEYALKDLAAEGFTAEIKERTVGDTVYYRVLIPDVGTGEVEALILELKDKGFEGFRVYD